MTVELLHNTPLEPCDIAICKCYGNTPHQDLEKVKKRIDRVANISKHSSVIEHINYTFDIDGISRACLQELARHRMFSFTVKSSRYTLQELKTATDEELLNFVVDLSNNEFDLDLAHQLAIVRGHLRNGVSNDIVKYLIPEAYKTSLVLTTNARALQNFLELRTSKHALWEIQQLSDAIYRTIPEEHKFMFKDCHKGLSNEDK